MGDLTFGLFVRGQYHAGDDMRKRFEEVKAQVRLADQLGFSDLLTGMHYAAAPFQQYQLIPLLERLLPETERSEGPLLLPQGSLANDACFASVYLGMTAILDRLSRHRPLGP